MTENNGAVIKALRQRLNKIEFENQILQSERDAARAKLEDLTRQITEKQVNRQNATGSRLEDGKDKRAPAEQIIVEVLKGFPAFTTADVLGPGRSKALTDARHECMYAVHKHRPDLSFPALGRIFGGRDHTTVMHAVKKIQTAKDQTQP
jgi:chromosomal replication initiation ATPase DnaA